DAWIYEARSGSTPASLNYSNENRHVGGSCRLRLNRTVVRRRKIFGGVGRRRCIRRRERALNAQPARLRLFARAERDAGVRSHSRSGAKVERRRIFLDDGRDRWFRSPESGDLEAAQRRLEFNASACEPRNHAAMEMAFAIGPRSEARGFFVQFGERIGMRMAAQFSGKRPCRFATRAGRKQPVLRRLRSRIRCESGYG
ncbi:hypothetical protein GGD83_002828, partial [Rhodoblastus sphagnicola]